MFKMTQQQVNEICVNHYEWAADLMATTTPAFIKRLNYCKAWVYGFQNDDVGTLIFALISYNSLVAVCGNGVRVDFSRYSYGYTATTSQHIHKFFKKYSNANSELFTYREV